MEVVREDRCTDDPSAGETLSSGQDSRHEAIESRRRFEEMAALEAPVRDLTETAARGYVANSVTHHAQ